MLVLVTGLIIILLYVLTRPSKYKFKMQAINVDDFQDGFFDLLNEKIEVGVYGTDKVSTYPNEHKIVRVGDMLNYNDMRFQYKSDLENEHPVDRYIDAYVKRKCKLRFPSCMLRIATAPWCFTPHFDCDDNYALVLYGSKTFLVFDMYKHKHERRILNEIRNKNISQTIPILDKYGIEHATFNMKAGDLLYIKSTMYHLVENREPSILLNFNPHRPNIGCGEHFKSIWKRQDKICKDNKCLY